MKKYITFRNIAAVVTLLLLFVAIYIHRDNITLVIWIAHTMFWFMIATIYRLYNDKLEKDYSELVKEYVIHIDKTLDFIQSTKEEVGSLKREIDVLKSKKKKTTKKKSTDSAKGS